MKPEMIRRSYHVQAHTDSGWETRWSCATLKEAREQRRERGTHYPDGTKSVRIVRITEEEVA